MDSACGGQLAEWTLDYTDRICGDRCTVICRGGPYDCEEVGSGQSNIELKLGKRRYCVMSYEEYKNMNVRIELLEILAEAEDDVKDGRVAPASETFGDLRKILQER